MSLDVVVSTTDEYLTTTQAVKDALGTTTTSNDAKLDAEILRASQWAQTFVGYPLTAAKYRETVPAYGTRALMLARTPLRAVSGLYYGTDTGEATQLTSTEFGTEPGPGFLTRPIGWEWSVPVESELALRPLPGQEFAPWLVDYVAGFTYAGIDTGSPNWSTEKGTTSTGRTLPRDIELAVIDKVVARFSGMENVFSKQVGDLRITYGAGQGSLGVEDQAETWLRPYVRTA